MIPYIEVHRWVLVPKDLLAQGLPPMELGVEPFGALVGIGVLFGVLLARSYGEHRGLDPFALNSFIVWVVGIGFIGGHAFDLLLYYPEQVLNDPASLLWIWQGQSSFGGFAGALIGTVLWRWRYQSPVLPYADVVVSAFPVSWVFGRMGCAITHDHPGVLSDAWYAVQFPGGARYDLGLYELVLTIPLALYFLWLRRGPQPWGTFSSRIALLYAPPRFFLDFLREREVGVIGGAIDVRYSGLTPAQWACIALFVFGLYLFLKTRNAPGYDAPRAPKSLA